VEVFERYAPVTEQLLPVVGTVLTLDMLGRSLSVTTSRACS
jgi:hypothetical protein